MTVEALIAHVREADAAEQTLDVHLMGTAKVAERAAAKLGLAPAGALLGLVHDLGKHSQEFQAYIRASATAPESGEGGGDVEALRGRIDHSTAGAQLLWRAFSSRDRLGQIVGQILSLCVASHHSGLVDCLTTRTGEGVSDEFSRRLAKADDRTHLEESKGKVDPELRARIEALLDEPSLVEGLRELIGRIALASPEGSDKSVVCQFQVGLLVRFLFSCLVAGDRQDTSAFERPWATADRRHGHYPSWATFVGRIEAHVATLQRRTRIDEVRGEVSEHCREAAAREKGLFTLTVPTGGGKTLASLRFALHHALRHDLDRVINIVPFTTIIDQNADVARSILEPREIPEDSGCVVLEHHSNLAPLKQSWRTRVLAEDWDAPVVYTTSVQFLEALFGAGTRGARRMHQLARSVLVFDEIQALPVKCVHLFNNAINFLVEQCGSTVVLCTATQPLLGEVDEKKGAAKLSSTSEIIPSVQDTFSRLQRVELRDERRPNGWGMNEVADLAEQEATRAGNCLIVVNTKKSARVLYRRLRRENGRPTYHLSTSMCPSHRRAVLGAIRRHLDEGAEIICVSTQLIEAGVDLDFGAVIRFSAGLDSVAQAAGRCNRHGARPSGTVHVVNPGDESLASLPDIALGREKSARVLDDYREDPGRFHCDPLGPEAMRWYYENYFFARKDVMGYRVDSDSVGREDTLLSLLSLNSLARDAYLRQNGKRPDPYLGQSFMTANREFQAIDAPTHGVVVPFGPEGRRIIAALCAACDLGQCAGLVRAAQQFTVNVFPHEFRALQSADALFEAQPSTEIYCLNEHFYSGDFGLSTEPVSPGELLHV